MKKSHQVKDILQVDVSEEKLNTWQEIVDTLAEIIGIPAGLIMRLNDPDIEVLVSSKGQDNPYHPGDKEKVWGSGLYCETVIKTRDRLIVPNALADENWKDNPDIKLQMISYLGFPIFLPDGSAFGTICVLDRNENAYDDTFEKLMRKFRDLIQADLEIIYMNNMLQDENKQLTDYISEIKTLRGILPICMHCKKIRDDKGYWNQVEAYIEKYSHASFSHGICQECAQKYYPGMDL
ncbi:MAG: GAF domain-containing protein [Desulfotignum sp.]|nr:GAF domain-containing protein [Desulfobacteraceae bacterium]